MKKILALFLTLSLTLSLFVSCNDSDKTGAKGDGDATENGGTSNTPNDENNGGADDGAISVGDVFTFGNYEQDNNIDNGKEAIEWMVLAVEDGKALLISKYALDAKQYHSLRANMTWENCTLRAWLNGDFMSETFSEAEQAKISSTTLQNPDNTKWNVDGGNDTTDKIFLLSSAEAQKYFAANEARACEPTAYAVARGVSVSEGKNAGNCYWWLRSPGYLGTSAACVVDSGFVHGDGNDMRVTENAVRPALWIDLAS